MLLVGWVDSDPALPVDDELEMVLGCDWVELETGDDSVVLTDDEELATDWLETGYV